MSEQGDVPSRREVPDDYPGASSGDAGADPTVAFSTAEPYPASTPRVRLSVVIGTIVAIIVVAGIVLIAGVLPSGDGSREPDGSTVASTASTRPSPSTPASAAGTTTTAARVYKAVGKPCEAADFSALEQRFGPARGTPLQHSTKTSARTSMSCASGFGRRGGTVVMQIEVLAGADGQIMYDGLRRVHVQQSQVQEVTDVGTAAYAYVNADVGTYVVAYDGNLYMSVAWSALGAAARAPEREITGLLAEVCRRTMANLA